MISEYESEESQPLPVDSTQEFHLFQSQDTLSTTVPLFEDLPLVHDTKVADDNDFDELKNLQVQESIKTPNEVPIATVAIEPTIPQVEDNDVSFADLVVTSTQSCELFVIESSYKWRNYTVTRNYGHLVWIQKALKEELPEMIVGPIPLQSQLEEYKNCGVRDFGGKLVFRFLHYLILQKKFCLNANLINFMTMNGKDFDKHVSATKFDRGFMFAMRMMGKTAPEEREFSSKDLVQKYQKLRPALLNAMKCVRDFRQTQWKYFNELDETAKVFKMASTLDPLMEEEFIELSDKLRFTANDAKKFFSESKTLPLWDELSILTLQLDQTLAYIENKATKTIEYQILRDDFENISRKQEKLRLDEKTKSKGDSMEVQVTSAESAYKKAKQILEDIHTSLPFELEKFQKHRTSNLAISLEVFIRQQAQSLKKVELIQ